MGISKKLYLDNKFYDVRETLLKIEGMCGVDITLPHIMLNLLQQEESEPSQVGELYCSYVMLRGSSVWFFLQVAEGDAATNDSTLVLKMKFLKFGILCQVILSQCKKPLGLLSLLCLDHLMCAISCEVYHIWHQKQTMAWVLHVFLSN